MIQRTRARHFKACSDWSELKTLKSNAPHNPPTLPRCPVFLSSHGVTPSETNTDIEACMYLEHLVRRDMDSSSPSESPSSASCNRRWQCPKSNRSTNDEHPFITFRRFADAQFASLTRAISDFPFSSSSPSGEDPLSRDFEDGIASRIKAWTKTRREMMEKMCDEMHRSSEDQQTRRQRRLDEMSQWGASSDEAKAESAKNRGRGRDDVAMPSPKPPESEKRLLELGWDGQQRLVSQNPKSNQTREAGIEKSGSSTDANRNGKRTTVRASDSKFQQGRDVPEDVDPFTQPGMTLPWLVNDAYSPLRLDHSLPRKPDGTSSEHRSINPWNHSVMEWYSLLAEPGNRQDGSPYKSINWRAAFHDLLDCHRLRDDTMQTCPKSAYAYSPSLAPGHWISILFQRGSLDPLTPPMTSHRSEPSERASRFRGGQSPHEWTIRPWYTQFHTPEDKGSVLSAIPRNSDTNNGFLPREYASAHIPQDTSTARGELMQLGQAKTPDDRSMATALDDFHAPFLPTALLMTAIPAFMRTAGEQRSLSASNKADCGNEMDILEEVLDEVVHKPSRIEPAMPQAATFGGFLGSAQGGDHGDGLQSAVPGAKKESQTTDTLTSALSSPSNGLFPPFSPHFPPLPSSKTSTSSYFYDNSDGMSSPDSVVSTVTTVETRTQPDGNSETKRVVKRTFADGHEESDQWVETQSDTPESRKPLSYDHSQSSGEDQRQQNHLRGHSRIASMALPSSGRFEPDDPSTPFHSSSAEFSAPMEPSQTTRKERAEKKPAGWFWN